MSKCSHKYRQILLDLSSSINFGSMLCPLGPLHSSITCVAVNGGPVPVALCSGSMDCWTWGGDSLVASVCDGSGSPTDFWTLLRVILPLSWKTAHVCCWTALLFHLIESQESKSLPLFWPLSSLDQAGNISVNIISLLSPSQLEMVD